MNAESLVLHNLCKTLCTDCAFARSIRNQASLATFVLRRQFLRPELDGRCHPASLPLMATVPSTVANDCTPDKPWVSMTDLS